MKKNLIITLCWGILGFLLVLTKVYSEDSLTRQLENDLVSSMFACNLGETNKILDQGLNPNFTIAGEKFPAGQTPASLVKFLHCFDEGQPYDYKQRNANYKLKLRKILEDHGASISEEGTYLLHGQFRDTYHDALFASLKICDVENVEWILQRGDYSLARFDGNDWYQGMNTIAYVMANFCGETKLYDEKVRDKVLAKKRVLINILVEHGADLNALVRVNDRNIYVPAYHIAFYTDVKTHATKLAVYAIMLGADKFAKTSMGKNILYMPINQGDISFDNLMRLLDVGVDFMGRDFLGADQSTLFPVAHYRRVENEQLLKRLQTKGFSFEGGDYSKEVLDHPFYREIEFAVDGRVKDNSNIEYVKYIEKFLIGNYPTLLNRGSGKEQVSPIMAMMKLFCPVTQFDKTISYSFDSKYETVSQRQKMYEARLYKWFLKFLKRSKFDVNFVDANGYGYMAYAVHFCPNEVVKVLQKKGLSVKGPKLAAKNVTQVFEDILGIDGINDRFRRLPFNNDHRNLSLLQSSREDYQQLSLPDYTFKNKKIVSQFNTADEFISWRSLDEYGLSRNGTLKIPVLAEVQFYRYTDILKHQIDPYKIKRVQTINVVGTLLAINYYNTKKSGPYSSMQINFPVTAVELENRGDYLDVTLIGDRQQQKQWISLKDPGGPVGITFKMVKNNKRSLHKRFVQSTLRFNGLAQLQLTKSNAGIFIEETIFGRYHPNIHCETPFCNFLTTKVDSAGNLNISIDETKLTNVDDMGKLLWQFTQADAVVRKELVDNAFSTTDVAFSLFFPDLLYLTPKTVIEEDVNRKILINLLRFIGLRRIQYDIDGLIKKLEDIKYLTKYGKTDYLLFKYLLGEGSLNTLVAAILGDSLTFKRFYINLTQFDHSFRPAIKDKLKEVIQDVGGKISKLRQKFKLSQREIDAITKKLGKFR